MAMGILIGGHLGVSDPFSRIMISVKKDLDGLIPDGFGYGTDSILEGTRYSNPIT